MRVEIPEPLRLRYRQTLEGRTWLEQLPTRLEQALHQWQLSIDLAVGAAPWHGHTAMVLPVLTNHGMKAVLKLAFPTDETLLEPLALGLWAGHGVLELMEEDDSIGAMLMERLDANRSLLTPPMEEAIPVWGELLRTLSIRPDDRPQWRQLPHIAGTAERYCDELPQRWSELGEPFPRWLLESALELCQTRGSVARRSSNDVLVHTDLHYQNILASLDGEHYLAIDPQAQLGDAEFAVAPCLWNRLHDLPERNAEEALRRRSSALAQAAGLNEDLSAAWAVVREVENALWYLESPGHAGDAQRSLWVASTMAGKTLPGLPSAHQLSVLS